MATTSKQKLLEIIQNGRQFLTALEEFAATNFPNDHHDDEEESVRLDIDTEDLISVDSAKEETSPPIDPPTEEERTTTAPSGTTAAANPAAAALNPTDASEQLPANAVPKLKRQKMTGPVVQFCAKTGKILSQYQSVNNAAETIAKSLPSNTKPSSCRNSIVGILNGSKETMSYKGYYFRYIGDTTTPMPTFPILSQYKQASTSATKAKKSKRTQRGVPILQFCAKTGKQIGNFENASVASISLAASIPGSNAQQFRTAISEILHGVKKRPVYRGFYFRSSFDTMSPYPEFPIPEWGAECKDTSTLLELEQRKKKKKTAKQTTTTTTASQTKRISASRESGRKRTREEQTTTNNNQRSASQIAQRNKRVPILQFCAKTGKQLGTFENATAAAKSISASIPDSNPAQFRTAISEILHGVKKRPVYRDFYFRSANDTTKPFPTFPIP